VTGIRDPINSSEKLWLLGAGISFSHGKVLNLRSRLSEVKLKSSGGGLEQEWKR